MDKIKKEILLVDGYNVIHGNEALKKALAANMNDAREQLAEILSDYAASKGWQLIIVFDAYSRDQGGSFEDYDRNTVIYFTGKDETADSFIEQMAYDLGGDYTLRVATSDKEQQYYVLSQGAIRVSARELWLDVAQTKRAVRRSPYADPSRRLNPSLQGRVDAGILAELEKLRRRKTGK